MASPSYLRQIANQVADERDRASLAPQRMLFRPTALRAGLPIEAETIVSPTPRPAALERPRESVAEPALPRLPGTTQYAPGALQLPAAADRRERAREEVVPARREIAAAPPTPGDMSERIPITLEPPKASSRFAPAPKPPAVNAAQETYPAVSELLPASRPALPTSVQDGGDHPGERHPATETLDSGRARDSGPARDSGIAAPGIPRDGLPLSAGSASRSAFAETIAARQQPVQLTPPIIRDLRDTGGMPDQKGVHIGSLEVHVAMPRIAAEQVAPTATVRATARAAVRLARGFPAFGLVQS